MKSIARNLLVYFFTTSVSLVSFSQVISDLQREGLQGKVHFVTQEYFSVKKNAANVEESQSKLKIEFEYDEAGFLKTLKESKTDNSIVRKTIYEYNDKGGKTKITIKLANGSIYRTTRYLYDNSGNVLLEQNNDQSEHLLSTIAYQYQSGNVCTDKYFFNKDSVLIKREEYKYDTDNLISEIAVIDSTKKIIFNTRYKYNAAKNKIQQDLYQNGVFESRNTYEYNEYRDPISKTVTTNNAQSIITSKFAYSYDKNGNWLKQTIITNAISKSIMVRQIQYYND